MCDVRTVGTIEGSARPAGRGASVRCVSHRGCMTAAAADEVLIPRLPSLSSEDVLTVALGGPPVVPFGAVHRVEIADSSVKIQHHSWYG